MFGTTITANFLVELRRLKSQLLSGKVECSETDSLDTSHCSTAIRTWLVRKNVPALLTTRPAWWYNWRRPSKPFCSIRSTSHGICLRRIWWSAFIALRVHILVWTELRTGSEKSSLCVPTSLLVSMWNWPWNDSCLLRQFLLWKALCQVNTGILPSALATVCRIAGYPMASCVLADRSRLFWINAIGHFKFKVKWQILTSSQRPIKPFTLNLAACLQFQKSAYLRVCETLRLDTQTSFLQVNVAEPSRPDKVRVYGPGIKEAKRGTPTHFVVDCKNAGPGESVFLSLAIWMICDRLDMFGVNWSLNQSEFLQIWNSFDFQLCMMLNFFTALYDVILYVAYPRDLIF